MNSLHSPLSPAATRSQLEVSAGQCSDRGRKPSNQDFYGLRAPGEPLLSTKGIAVAIADGISSSDVSHVASETAVASFLEDYFCTPETWSVKKSAHRVLSATNSWLQAQTRHGPHYGDNDRGYLCTFSALILKSVTAHILHVGDTRIYRLRDQQLEQITSDHRVRISHSQSYLGRALGLDSHVEIDYHTLTLLEGDTFILATDGVYEFVDKALLISTVQNNRQNPEEAARLLVSHALERGSDDNLTVQIVHVDSLPVPDAEEMRHYSTSLPCPPLLEKNALFDGFKILDPLYASSRSHVYLAREIATDAQVVLKIPSLDLRHDPVYLERLMLEEWIARRIHSQHVIKAFSKHEPRQFLYTVSEYIDGITLTQWMQENPRAPLETVMTLVQQIARGLQAFHRLEILHQDIRPDNILIDRDGVAKIIDMGSAKVASISETATLDVAPEFPGTLQYMAPEYFRGDEGVYASDIFSFAVVIYHMLTGKLPYGTDVARLSSRSKVNKLVYQPARLTRNDLPPGIDTILQKALHPDPQKRFPELSEFLHALNHPYASEWQCTSTPLIERNPVIFWQCLSVSLLIALLVVLNLHLDL